MSRNDTAEGIRIGRVAAVATLLAALLASLLIAAPADAATVKFNPVRKTNHALVFKPRGLPVSAIRGAKVTLRSKGRRVERRQISAKHMRSVVCRRASLRVPFQPTARPRRLTKKGDGRLKVKVVVEDPSTDDGGTTDGGTTDVTPPPSDTTAPDTSTTAGPAQGSSTTSTSASGEVYTVPSSVPSGCSTDATSQILSWIASVPNNSTLLFGANACYRIEGTLELRNRNLTFDGNGSTFKSLNAPSGQRALWRAVDSTVVFRNMTIIGSYGNGGVFTDNLQWAHGIDLRGTHGVVEDVSMSDLAGDCVYFGLGASQSSGAVRDSSCRRIGRNAVSVTAGDDIRVERVTTDRIGYIVFDVEPNTGSGNGSSRVVFDSNTIGSYYMKAYTVIGNAPVADQAFTNNRLVGQGLKIGVVNRTYRPRRLRITGNSSDTAAAPAAMNIDGVDGLTVSGNTVPLTSGTMAKVDSSCDVSVSGNSYPGGSQEASITNPQF